MLYQPVLIPCKGHMYPVLSQAAQPCHSFASTCSHAESSQPLLGAVCHRVLLTTSCPGRVTHTGLICESFSLMQSPLGQPVINAMLTTIGVGRRAEPLDEQIKPGH